MESNISMGVFKTLKSCGIDFVVSVPCKLLERLIKLLEKEKEITFLPVTREEEGFGLCAGAYLGGKFPCIVMPNSGLGNSINALASLIQFYRIPMILVISFRGTPGEKVGAQVPMGQVTIGLLDQLKIPYYHFHYPNQVLEMNKIIDYAKLTEFPVAILMDFNFWNDQS